MSQRSGQAAVAAGDPEHVRVLRFRVGGRRCAIEAGHLAGVVDTPAPTAVPHTAGTVDGVAPVQGSVTVFVDLHEALGEPRRGPAEAVVVERGPDETPVGFAVDAIEGLGTVHVDRIRPTDGRSVFAGTIDDEDGECGLVGVDRLAALADSVER